MLDKYLANMQTIIKTKNPSLLVQFESNSKKSVFKWYNILFNTNLIQFTNKYQMVLYEYEQTLLSYKYILQNNK